MIWDTPILGNPHLAKSFTWGSKENQRRTKLGLLFFGEADGSRKAGHSELQGEVHVELRKALKACSLVAASQVSWNGEPERGKQVQTQTCQSNSSNTEQF